MYVGTPAHVQGVPQISILPSHRTRFLPRDIPLNLVGVGA